jgi:RNA recognition motif-containing protein
MHPRNHDGDLSKRRLFVENLPPGCDWRGLKDHARWATGFNVAYASVSVDSEGYSKQCGVIQFESTEDAEDAIQTLDGTEMAEEENANPYVITARMDRQQRERRQRRLPEDEGDR